MSPPFHCIDGHFGSLVVHLIGSHFGSLGLTAILARLVKPRPLNKNPFGKKAELGASQSYLNHNQQGRTRPCQSNHCKPLQTFRFCPPGATFIIMHRYVTGQTFSHSDGLTHRVVTHRSRLLLEHRLRSLSVMDNGHVITIDVRWPWQRHTHHPKFVADSSHGLHSSSQRIQPQIRRSQSSVASSKALFVVAFNEQQQIDLLAWRFRRIHSYASTVMASLTLP